MRIVLWIAVAALIVFPVAYFALHWWDPNFRDGAVGNWFGTVVGVVVGIPVGLALAEAQQNSQVRAERSRQEQVKREQQRSLRHRVYQELEYNATLVVHLSDVLSKSESAASGVWNWAVKIAESIEFDARRELESTLAHDERAPDAAVGLAYLDLKRLVHRVRESAAAYAFLLSEANHAEANSQVNQAKAHTRIVLDEIGGAIDALRSYRG